MLLAHIRRLPASHSSNSCERLQVNYLLQPNRHTSESLVAEDAMAKGIVKTNVDGSFRQTNLTREFLEYLAKRAELCLAEIELMKQRERVADLRRHLPEGALVQDYEFEEGPRELNAGDSPVSKVRLSEVFTKPNRPLVIY